MIDISVLRAMAAAGASVEVILAALEAALEIEAEKTAERLAKDAARSARYRDRGGGKIPGDLRQAVFERDEFACVYCGSEAHLQCDHAIPVSKGGETTIENLVTACRTCNSRKKDRERKAFERSLEKQNSEDVRGNSEDVRGNSELSASAPSSSPPTPPLITTPTLPFLPAEILADSKQGKEVVVDGRDTAGRAPPGAFERFWELYPHKIGKGAARKSFESALKRVDLETMITGLRRYVGKVDDRPWCNPATWLNQDRWADQPAMALIERSMTSREKAAANWSNALGKLDQYAGRATENGGSGGNSVVSILPPAAGWRRP